MESLGDFTDNTQAVYEYMRKNGYLEKYRVVWLADDPEELMQREDIKAVSKRRGKPNLALCYYMAICKYYIYSHNNFFNERRLMFKRKKQIIFNLWHGVGYKAIDGVYKDNFRFIISTGEYGTMVLSHFFQCEKEKLSVLGYPRTDYFFINADPVRKRFNDKFNFGKYSKVILWMPTFRKNKDKSVHEIENISETGLPLLTEEKKFADFNTFLSKYGMLFILKVHPAQEELPIFKTTYSNILILSNHDLDEMRIQLYQFIPLSDALVTDYSSIGIDYMLLDKPIIFTLDDYDDYASSRGFYPLNAIDYMPGYHVYSIAEMEDAILEIADGKDIYKPDREKLMPAMHRYTDGNSSKRVLDFLGITKD
ncbi:MAG: CDP-glycerol glycerophosphotransferase family protein [Ruminococcus sp.]|nr:CDP-glycerol glycerophosphotransferase family protein [Ruminococcus sp.]